MKTTLTAKHRRFLRQTSSHFRKWLLAFAFSLSFSQSASSELLCSKNHEGKNPQESAVEIEITGDVVEALFTTTDGTIGPVVGATGREGIPEKLLKELESSFPGQDPLKTPWDLLSLKEKKELILHSAKQAKQDFFVDRKVHGLKYRETLELRFRKPTAFLGRNYLSGKYRFPTADIFGKTAIEFSGPVGMEKNLGLEIHLRTFHSAGQNFRSSIALQEALTNHVSPVHEHIVDEMPLKAMAENPKLTALKMTEFYRRVSLLAQTFRILLKHEVAIRAGESGTRYYEAMPILTRDDLKRIHHYFKKFGEHLQTDEKSPFYQGSQKVQLWKDNDPLLAQFEKNQGQLIAKSGLVGIRAGTVYDGSITKWGLEMRDLTPTHDLQIQEDLINSIQARLSSQDFGISDQVLNQTLTNSRLTPIEQILMYPSAAGLELKPAALASFALKFQLPKLADLKDIPTDNEAVGFLFHHWEIDPLLLQFPESREQILSSQRMALSYLAHGMSVKDATAWFVRKSALQRLLLKSILLK